MKKPYYLITILFVINLSYSQVGINTTNPDTSSILDIVSTDKGVLFPRVNLTSLTDITTIMAPAEGLIVYSSSSNCNVPAGLYLFNGTNWEIISCFGLSNSYSRLIRDEIGVANVTFTAYSSTNTFGNYSSLFDGIDNIAGASFYSDRSGSPTGDWGFGVTLPKPYFISELILDGRNDCCTSRIENVTIRLYACGNLVYSSPSITSSITGDNTVSIPNIYADEIRLVVGNGGTTTGGAVINFSELDVVAFD